jgi:hypothetical protein
MVVQESKESPFPIPSDTWVLAVKTSIDTDIMTVSVILSSYFM